MRWITLINFLVWSKLMCLEYTKTDMTCYLLNELLNSFLIKLWVFSFYIHQWDWPEIYLWLSLLDVNVLSHKMSRKCSLFFKNCIVFKNSQKKKICFIFSPWMCSPQTWLSHTVRNGGGHEDAQKSADRSLWSPRTPTETGLLSCAPPSQGRMLLRATPPQRMRQSEGFSSSVGGSQFQDSTSYN